MALMFGLLASPALAQVPDPVPNTYTDWEVPNLTKWNGVNVRTVGTTLNDVSYIYPDAAIRDADAIKLSISSAAIPSSSNIEVVESPNPTGVR